MEAAKDYIFSPTEMSIKFSEDGEFTVSAIGSKRLLISAIADTMLVDPEFAKLIIGSVILFNQLSNTKKTKANEDANN